MDCEAYKTARTSMVSRHLVPRGIADHRVLAAMGKVPRHLFVPEDQRDSAYGDHPLSVGCGQTISQPYIVAFMTEALKLSGGERVLEIGTGSGYQTAVLAEIASEVFTVERIGRLLVGARAALDGLGYRNIRYRLADGTNGWPGEAPFDAVIVTAAGPKIPAPLLEQLAEGARLVMPLGGRFRQRLVRVVREKENNREEYLMDVRFVSLMGEHGWSEE